MDVRVELSRIVITETDDAQLVFLREKGGERSFPIFIGIAEAYAIDRRLKKIPVPRPMTHDLLGNVIEAMGGRLEKIVINDLRAIGSANSQTFIATLHIRRGDEIIEVDCRPSDAIALGVAWDTPIYVAEHVMKMVLDTASAAASLDAQVQVLRMHMEALQRKIADLSARLADEDFLSNTPPTIIKKHRIALNKMRAECQAVEHVLKKLQ